MSKSALVLAGCQMNGDTYVLGIIAEDSLAAVFFFAMLETDLWILEECGAL